jgi:hypothetical protein
MSHLSEEQLDHLVARERARQQAPLNDWQTIAARAREEGLIHGSESRSWSGSQSWIQAAAAVLILVGGIAIGRTTTGLPTATEVASSEGQTTAAPVAASNPTQIGSITPATFTSVDQASETLERALADYQRASAFLAVNSTGPTTVDSSQIYSARLAALNQVGNAMERALRTAPHDPVINQYYLATMGARMATQQLASRPVGIALTGF